MPCETLTDEKGEMVGIVCSAPWGMGVTTYRWEEDGEEFEDSIYGFGGRGDPHDFDPDTESNTPEEIAAWEAAKAACPNHPNL